LFSNIPGMAEDYLTGRQIPLGGQPYLGHAADGNTNSLAGNFGLPAGS
jgi:hypothetical protein